MKLIDYINTLGITSLPEVDKAKFLCFYYQKKNRLTTFTISDIKHWFIDAGFSEPNTSRLKKNLLSLKIMKFSGTDLSFILTVQQSLEKEYNYLFDDNITIISHSEIIDERKFCGKPRCNYLDSLIKQINACYRENCYDAAAVIMRRLFEILLILTYQHLEIDDEIKDSNGYYMMLDSIVNKAKLNKKLNLSRIKMQFDNFRKVGNFSAHKIYYNASIKDIDDIKKDYRVMLEELYHKAGLI